MSSELAVIGADTANMQAGSNASFFDRTKMFTGSAVISGLSSIYNTFVDLGNMAGGDFEPIDVSRRLSLIDRNWYNYYKENESLVDVTGFIGSSLIPGTLAIKGLKAVQVGHSAGAVGRAVQGPLSFFLSKRDEQLELGLKAIATEGGSAYSYINANKWASMGWGLADNMLQAAAFESAVALTMYKSPVLADASKADIISDIGFGMFVGGGFGGAIDAILTNKIFKNAVLGLGKNSRIYDTPPNYSKLGLPAGDEAYGFIDSLMGLADDIAPEHSTIEVMNILSKKPVELDITKALQKNLEKTKKDQLEAAQLALHRLGTEDTPEVAQKVTELMMRMIKQGTEAGLTKEQIRAKLGNMFLGFKKATILPGKKELTSASKDEIFYLADEVDLGKLGEEGATIDTFLKMAKSNSPFEKNATAKPWRLVGNLEEAKITATSTTFNDAWANGFDLAVIGGKMRINPKSALFERVDDPTLVPSRYFNTRTGAVSDESIATWADMMPAGSDARKLITADGVIHGNTLRKVASNLTPKNSIAATARHAWATTLGPRNFAGSVIDPADISRLDRLAQLGLPAEQLDELDVFVRLLDDTEVPASSLDLASHIADVKLAKLTELLDDTETLGRLRDPREIAYMLNVEEEWIERAIANGFQRTGENDLVSKASRKLEEYLERENFIGTWQSPKSLVELGVVSKEALEAATRAANQKGAKYVDTFATGELGFKARVDKIIESTKNAFVAVFGDDARGFLDLNTRDVIKIADELGAGASALGASNADYGNMLKLWAQHTGGLTHKLIAKIAEANLNKISPFIDMMKQDVKAGAELGVITTMLRKSDSHFYLLDDSKQLVVRDVLKKDQATGEFSIDGEKLQRWLEKNPGQQAVFDVDSQKVVDFLSTWKNINGERVNKRAAIMNSRGATLGWDPEAIYAPPIDTQRYPHFAFIKIKQGHIASNSDVGMITARSAEELNKLSKEVPDQFDVYYKADTEQYYKIKDEYDAQMSMNEPRVNSMMHKRGKLFDAFYEVRPENVMEDYVRFSQNADTALVRHGVETRYAQLFTELEALGNQYTKVATSQMSGRGKLYDKTAVNPFKDYLRTALDISKRSSFPLISQMNEFVDSVGTTAYRILVANTDKAKAGLVSWQEAEQIATKYGIGGMYAVANDVEAAFKVANRPADRNLIREGVSKANMFLATVGLRLDTANALVNIISTPIMLGTELASLKSLARSNPEAIGALRHLSSISPDGTIQVPSTLKVVGQAISNILGKDGKKLIEGYRQTGEVKDVVLQFHDMLGELAINPMLGAKGWKKSVDAAVEKGATWTGNNFAEDFTRALTANVMDQYTAPLIAAKLLTLQEAAAYRSVFVNRVNGNYISSQRPILFQGTVGAAVSLFQTYVFNVMQQLVRHIEDRSTRALLTMGGLQGAIYGLNGIPFFDAVNTHLIGNAAINDGHRDVYSATTELAGKELGNWLLYGTASGLPLFGDKSPALFTRGDINPRHITVLPVSPMDIPAVDVTIRIAKNIADIGSKLVNGADFGPALLEGLEHNGVSRPMAGFAQLAQGYTSTSKGSLVSAANEFSLVVASTRMLGARPMDEAVALNAMFREQAYKAADLERLSKLGEVVKTKLRGNQMPTEEEMNDFMRRYASAGGTLQNYASALQRWSRDANMSVVEQMKRHHATSYAQRLSEIMGGTTLEDFVNAQSELSQQAPR
jgi:hypothetical protein